MKTNFSLEIDCMSSERGIGLVSALMIITALTSFIVIIAGFSWTNSHKNALEASNGKAFYLAESGIQYALQRSITLNEWDWNQSGNYADGKVTVSVLPGEGNEILIRSRAEMENTAKCNSLLLNVFNILNYSVFISGEVNGIIGYDSFDHLYFNSTSLPAMELDSLKQVAQSQGNYFDKNETIDNHSPDYKFWSNPSDHNQNATIVYAEQNLTIDKTNKGIGAIFVVMGDLVLQDSKSIDGVIYMANTSSMQTVDCKGNKAQHTLQGAVIGNTDINSADGRHGPELTVYYDDIYIEKFYTYSITGPSIIEKVSWTAIY